MEWGGLPSEFSVIQSAFGKDVFYGDKGEKKGKKRNGKESQKGSCRGKKSA